MKKTNLFLSTIIALVAISLAFISCAKDDDPNYAELLKGTWVNTMVNDQPVLTDATFIMEFKSDNTELHAFGFQVDENNKSWQENSNYTYSISGSLITIDGTDGLGNSMHLVSKIQSLDNETITYTVPTFSINGDVLPNANTYTCKKVTEDFSDEFVGVWCGRCTTEGAADSLYHYWEYFADGSNNFYYQDENGNWIKNPNNEGRYYLYGSLLANNYSYNLPNGNGVMTFECMNITVDGNNMLWTGLRENNITITYEMEKVSSPPETVQ